MAEEGRSTPRRTTPSTPACSSTTRPSSSRPSSSRGAGSSRSSGYDRFIPNRAAMDMTVSHFELTNHDLDPENPAANASPAKEAYKKQLARKLFDGEPGGSNSVFNFHGKAPKTSSDVEDTHRVLRSLYVQNRGSTPKKYSRHIPQAPERILDAPELLDDYYLNLLDCMPPCAPQTNPGPADHSCCSCFGLTCCSRIRASRWKQGVRTTCSASRSATASTCGTRPTAGSSSCCRRRASSPT